MKSRRFCTTATSSTSPWTDAARQGCCQVNCKRLYVGLPAAERRVSGARGTAETGAIEPAADRLPLSARFTSDRSFCDLMQRKGIVMSGSAPKGFCLTSLGMALALTACGSASESVSEKAGRLEETHTDRDPPLTLSSSAADVAGKWDVVSFEGYRPQRISGTVRAAYADFGTSGVSLRLECNYTGRSGRVVEGRFVAAPTNERIQTQIGCGPERGPREERYFTFFERTPSVEFVGDDRLHLRAGQDELILERPSARRLSYLASSAELQGEWAMVEVSWFPPGGGVAGIGLSEAANRLVIEGNRLRVRGCPEVDLTFQYTIHGQLRKLVGAMLPAGPLACPGLSDMADGPALPKASDAIRLLHADPLVEKAGDGALLLSTGEYALLIMRPPA